MSDRVTKKQLEFLVERINAAAGTPPTSYTKTKEGKFKANPGNYHLDGAYGGHQLVQMTNDGGGITVISEGGYLSKKVLWQQLRVILSGIEIGKGK